jgi:hypothetical protein
VTLQSTIDIDVNDAKFQRFADMFKKYEEALAKQPDVWKKIAAAQGTGATAFEKQTRSLAEQVDAHRDLADALDKQNVTLTHTDRLWTTMARSTKEVSGNIVSATTSLLRWTGILGLVGGALGIGGFLGIGDLSSSIAGQRRSRLGRGMGFGEQKAFGVDFGRFVDTDSFMDQVAEMEGDIRLQTPAFVGLGRRLSGNTEQDAIALLRRGFSVAHGTADPSNLGWMFQSAGLSGLFDPATRMRLFGTTPNEFEEQLKNNKIDTKAFDLKERVQRDYQEAATSLERFRGVTEATVANALDPFAKKIPQLTEEFSKAIAAFAKWPVIKEAIDSLADFADNIAHPGKLLAGLNAIPETHVWDVGSKWISDAIKGWMHTDPLDLGKIDKKFGLPAGWLELVKDLERSNANAISPKGALGMFQLMPGTAKQYGVTNPLDPMQSATGAARYFGDLEQRYKGDLAAMLAAYNWGPTNVDRVRAQHPADWMRYLPAETQNYVGRGMVLTINNQTGGSATVAGSQVGGQ